MTSARKKGVLTAYADRGEFRVPGIDKFFIIKYIITKSGSLDT
jgi:hypothetical protein